VSASAPAGLEDLLVRHRDRIAVIVRHEARGLLRLETEDDLVQGVQLRALESRGSFAWQGEGPFQAWLRRLAETHLADRRTYWGALKRRSGRVLRLAYGDIAGETGAAAEPAATNTGPSTFAARRERLLLVAKTLDALLPRDRDLVRWTGEGMTLEDQAARLGVSYEAAGKARQRALERFRKTWAVASGETLPLA
jgi:RNA polymerase sigma factor (sigma-70 family)